MTEEEHLEWTVDGRRRDLSIIELFNSMPEEYFSKLGEELLREANIEYINLL